MLRFSPYAWAKLHHLCHAGDTEIGGFALTLPQAPPPETAAREHDASSNSSTQHPDESGTTSGETSGATSGGGGLLGVVDLLTVRQNTTAVTVELDDLAVAELFEQQVELGRRPEQFARIWCHTHPGDSAHPSATDEETFDRVFGGCDWAVMFILAKGGETYARLRFNHGPGGDLELDVEVDYSLPFPESDHKQWQAEYDAHVQPVSETTAFDPWWTDGLDPWDDLEGLDDQGLTRERLEALVLAQGGSPADLEALTTDDLPPEDLNQLMDAHLLEHFS